MTRLSDAFGVSRETVYTAREQGRAVLDDWFGAPERSELIATVAVDRRQLERAVVALRAMGPNSIRVIEDLLPVLYPGVSRSYGTIQGILTEAEERSTLHNAGVDLSGIGAGALDEMFSQGDAVLAGVNLDSGYLFGLELRESRGGEDWAELLRRCKDQGLSLDVVVKDAALGIAAGVRAVFPQAEQRDDCFHAHYAINKQLRRMETAAYGAIAAEVDAEKAIETLRRKAGATRAQRRSLDVKLGQVRTRCRTMLELHDAFAVAADQAREGMEVVDLDAGELRRPERMQSMLLDAADAMQAVEFRGCGTVGRYLANRAPGLVLYAADLREQLGQVAHEHGDGPMRLAAVSLRLMADLRRRRRRWKRHEDQRHLTAAFARLVGLVGLDAAPKVMAAVEQRLLRRHRASSAIEGFNAALRPYLYVHKGVSSGFLALFQARYNLRVRRWGRHKGTSAHEVVTCKRVGDWLSVLGYAPTSPSN